MKAAGERGVSAAGATTGGLPSSGWGLRGGLGGSSLIRTMGLLLRERKKDCKNTTQPPPSRRQTSIVKHFEPPGKRSLVPQFPPPKRFWPGSRMGSFLPPWHNLPPLLGFAERLVLAHSHVPPAPQLPFRAPGIGQREGVGGEGIGFLWQMEIPPSTQPEVWEVQLAPPEWSTGMKEQSADDPFRQASGSHFQRRVPRGGRRKAIKHSCRELPVRSSQRLGGGDGGFWL